MNEAKELQVLDLEKVDEQEAYRFLTELFTTLSPEAEYAIRHEDYVLEMPQSGERIRGRENMRAFQEAYPAQPSNARMSRIVVGRVLVRESLWVVEGAADYPDGRTLGVVMITELRDGKMWRDRWYFAEPFEAPEWRARWVERMQIGAQPLDGRAET